MKETQVMSDDSGPTQFNGQFLVSMPDLKDGVFDSSLVLLCEHGETGAMGFIVNKPTEFSVQEIFEQLNLDAADGLDPDIPVMTGGPVEPQRGFHFPTTQSLMMWLKCSMDYSSRRVPTCYRWQLTH